MGPSADSRCRDGSQDAVDKGRRFVGGQLGNQLYGLGNGNGVGHLTVIKLKHCDP